MNYENRRSANRRRYALSGKKASRTLLSLESLEGRVLLASDVIQPGTAYANHLSSDLLALYTDEYVLPNLAAAGPKAPFLSAFQQNLIEFDAQGRVGVTITAKDVNAVLPALEADFGFVATASLPASHEAAGYLPVAQLVNATNLVPQGLLGILAIDKPITSQVGTFNDQAVNVLEADRVSATPNSPSNITGAGVTVGVLSNSFNELGQAATDESNGNLPSSVNVLSDYLVSGSDDEGRAMLQLVHHTAPGAAEDFATAFVGGDAGFANNIQALANAGAKVIADDVSYFDEPLFQDGVIAQAINSVVTTKGVSYFSSAGNIDTQAYLNTTPSFTFGGVAGIGSGTFLNFTPSSGTNLTQGFSLASGQGLTMTLEWDSPFYTTNGVATSLNFYIVNTATNTVVASSTTDATATQTPYQIVGYKNTGASTANYAVVIQLAKGPAPGALKYVNYGANQYGDITFQYATNSPTINAHAAADNAMAVGAAPYFRQTTPEGFTSAGPALILFNANGTRLSSSVTRAKPDILSIDGTDNTVLGSDAEGDGFPNFFGTSAAAPHAAAVAALMLQANPSLTPSQLYAQMKATATPVTASANVAGAGLLDAYRAVYGAPVPAAIPFSDGFETGAATQPWTLYKSGTGEIVDTTANGPASGSNQLALQTSIDLYPTYYTGLPSLDEAILNVNAATGQNVTLTYNLKAFDTAGSAAAAAAAAMPASFTGHGNYDGVSFSVDGNTWYRLSNIDITQPANQSYQAFTFNLSQIAAGLGLTLSSDTQIKFQHYTTVTFRAPHDGIAIDNVGVTGTTQSATTTTLTSSANPSVFGQSVTFTATVSASASGAGTPTGTVTFLQGTTTLATATLNSSGVATFSTAALLVGTTPITAVYAGTPSFFTSTSTTTSQVVNQAATNTALASSANPSVFGQSVTFTATVSAAAPGAGTPSGTVTFLQGTTTLGTATLNSSGVATFATAAFAVGTTPITVVYGGDANFTTSTSTAFSQVVNQAATTTSLTSSANPSVFGQLVTFTATVSAAAPGAGTPLGIVTFLQGATTLGTATLNSSGVATFATAAFPVGTSPITVVYGGNANFTTSTSTAVSQVVNQAATTTTLATSVNPSVFGQSVTFTATVNAAAPGSGTPAGIVTFLQGTTTLGTATLNNSGVATFATAALLVGTAPITAVYGASTNFTASTSTAVSQVVAKASTTSSLTSSANPASPGQSLTLTATVNAVAPGAGTPTGVVKFLDGTTLLGSASLSVVGVNDQASFTISTLSPGTHSITAVYGSDANFGGGTSTSLSELILNGPTVVTTAATSVTATGATLNGTVNPNGKPATSYFQYSTNSSFVPTLQSTVASGFNKPYAVAEDGSGNLFIADTANNVVKEIVAGTGVVVTIGSGFSSPTGVAVDLAGNVFVADKGNAAVKEVLAGTGAIVTIGSGFKNPVGVAVDLVGDVFVADARGNAVKEVVAGTGAIKTIGSGFISPEGVAVDAAGDVFVADFGNLAVKEVVAGTGAITTIGSGFNFPFGVAVDAAGDVFVADYGNNAVKEVVAKTTVTLTIGSGFNSPVGVATDNAGNVFVADSGNNRIVELSVPVLTAAPSSLSGSTASAVSASLSGLTPGATYYYRAVALGAGSINVGATLSLKTLAPIVTTSPVVSVSATGATLVGAVNSQGATAAVSFQYSTSPSFAPTVQSTFAFGFNRPYGVAVDALGDVFIADAANNAVKEVVAGSGTVVTIGSGFSSPYGVAVDAAGDVFVADYGNNAVKEVFAGTGTIKTIGSGFASPFGVAVDAAGDVFVADTGNNAVKEVLAPSGAIKIIGSGFIRPTGVAVDPAGDVFVADYGLNAVQEVLAGTSTIKTIGSGFSFPFGVAVDALGDVFIADNDGGAVSEVLAGSGTILSVGSGLTTPSGVAVDAAGNLFIADSGNNRVVELSSPSITATPGSVSGSTATTLSASLSGLAPGTTYYYRALASTTGGFVVGSTLSLTTLLPAPTVTTTAATTVTSTLATLNGTVNPNGSTTTSYFQYSISASFTPTIQSIIGSGFSKSSSVAVDAAGDVFIADSGNNVVKEVVAGTGAIKIIGSGFSNPLGLAVDSVGDVFVADTGNAAVKEVLAGSGVVKTILGKLGGPRGVAVDGFGDVFVADTGNNAVKEVIAGTGVVKTIGSGFNYPVALALDAAGDVFVADRNNNAVKEVVAATGATITIGSGFSGPNAVAVDSAGDVFVGDTGNKVVKEVVAGTGTILKIGSGFTTILGVAVDSVGDIFVADSGNNRVVEYAPPTITATPASLGGSTASAISAALSGLTPNTKYYYRAVGSGVSGIGLGATLSFTTTLTGRPPGLVGGPTSGFTSAAVVPTSTLGAPAKAGATTPRITVESLAPRSDNGVAVHDEALASLLTGGILADPATLLIPQGRKPLVRPSSL